MRSVGLCMHRCRVHARRVARLLVRERQTTAQAAQLRHAIDRALLAARCDRVPHAEVAAEYLRRIGAAGTADEHDRVVGRLRQRAAVAAARTGARGPDKVGVAVHGDVHNHVDMNQTPYRRRIVEEWYDTAPDSVQDREVEDQDREAELGGPILRGDEEHERADLAGDEDDDEDDGDDEEDD